MVECSIEVIDTPSEAATWPELTPECAPGAARILQTALTATAAAGAQIRAHIWIGDRWQAEISVNGERHAEEAAFDQGHHLLYKLADFAARHCGATLSDGAVHAFADLQTRSPGALLAFCAGRHQRAFELDPHMVAARLALALRAAQAGNPAAAAALVRGVAVHDGRAAAELGLELFSAGENEVAADLLQAAVHANPQDAVVMAALAALLARRAGAAAADDAHNALDEAQLLATQATQLAADDFRTWSALADVHRARADFKQAGFYYAFALRLAPDARAANLLKDASASWIMAGQPQQALPLIERGLALAPDDADHHGNLAFARDLMGDAQAALFAARQAAKFRPNDARLRILHGDLALKADRRDEALEAWARAAELEPGTVINPEGGNLYVHPPAANRH